MVRINDEKNSRRRQTEPDNFEKIMEERSRELGEANRKLINEVLTHYKAHDQLKKERRLIKAILNSLSVGVLFTSKNGKTLIENLASKKIWGARGLIKTNQDQKGVNCLDFISKFMENSAGFPHEAVFVNKLKSKNVIHDIIEIQIDNGDKRFINCSIVTLYDENDAIEGTVVFSQDVTEQKKAEKALEDSEKKYRRLLELSQEGIFVIDAENKITFVNQALCKMLKFKESELAGKHLVKFIAPDEIENSILNIEKAKKSGTSGAHERRFIDKNGEAVHTKLLNSRIAGENNEYGGQIVLAVNVTEQKRLEEEILKSRMENLKKHSHFEIVGKSPYIKELVNNLPTIADIDCNVLIEGPSGTGKSFIARAIHGLSDRKNKPFVVINCGSLPETLFESELFGYKKGAFTDARSDKSGKLAAAEGGVIFFDEISEMPVNLQVKLLRVIEDKCYEPLGSVKTLNTDIRIIAATNRDLMSMIKAKKFREDLYYRLKIINIKMPPLNDRPEDIELLAEHFLAGLGKKYKKNIIGLSRRAIDFLKNYNFHGNIRQMHNMLENAYVFCKSNLIDIDDLPIDSKKIKTKMKQINNGPAADMNVKSSDKEDKSSPENPSDVSNANFVSNMKQINIESKNLEKKVITDALKKFKNNRNETARHLEVSRITLWRKMKEHGLL